MTQPLSTVDADTQALMTQVVRFGVYLLRWIIKRYRLEMQI